jgi:deoxycytidine triphosphate deaminase
MMLNKKEILFHNLIPIGFEEASLREAGYDLRIATLMNKNVKGEMERCSDDIDLTPQGIAAVTSQEILKLPTYICAYASVKTSLCREGVLAINVGVVDPGWEGPLSSVLLNFGKDAYRLRSGDSFLRLTFHYINDMHQELPKTFERSAYEQTIEQKFSKRLAASFMDMDGAAKKGGERFAKDLRMALFTYLPLGALILAGLTFLVNFGTLKLANWTTPSELVLTRAKALTSDIDRRADKADRENAELRKEVQSLKDQVELLKPKNSPKSSR